MKKSNLFSKGLLYFSLLATTGTMISCNDENNPTPEMDQPSMAPEAMFTALTNDNRISTFEARNLGNPITTLNITGIADGEKILSIDYRPATGQLYALGSSSRLYIINENSGLATPLGAGPFSPGIMGENASLDFNPTVDRIRLVTESGQNLRLHPELGTVVATDGSINGGSNPKIGAVAYTNSMAGATATELFDIDFEANKLYVQDPPNAGGLREIGNLGIDFAGQGNFDISPNNSVALAVTLNEGMSKLYTINLSSGSADWVGSFNLPVMGIAIKTNPVAFAATADQMLYRFDPTNPTMNSVPFVGLTTGEMVIGLDFRPVNGQLYAITNMSRLLSVNTANGQVAEIGSGLNPMLEGTSFGFDFNPTVDRIRLVSNTGQNLRLHPDLGTVVVTDGNLNPGTPFVNGAAYTNSFASATSTVLFVVDSQTNMLYRQDPPNDGVLVQIGSLGIDIESENGFDIGGTSNNAFGLFKVGGTTAVYGVNLMSGQATKVADFNINATAMAVGLGF
ncbi:hypothetical protein P872_10020 [Rhodonellum psychrophilum GCM71 = DSM 17998]|uniref:DUF4394 domain-containing protein n=2 Tax=Rhodonellum TaxID=336827 RepID=U5BUR2_9BACT|nr:MULTISPECIES: DUF4394 domain-containing protein [Rhodonellum]ERM81279.1 hypothetical protein P872_10020 [Rhodonellum psychrophilum GCM71 = DSM 17998]